MHSGPAVRLRGELEERRAAIREKEKELQELIVNLNERNKNTTLKDTIITNLKKSIQKLNED